MCNPVKIISGALTLFLLIIFLYMYWDDIVPVIQKLLSRVRFIDQSTKDMGSGNSSPVERAQTVETEAHQDVFELRFDHLIFGGTSVLLIVAGVGLCWYCRRRNKKRRQRKQQSCQCQLQTMTNQQPTMPMMPTVPTMPSMLAMSTMPWYLMMPTMPYIPPATNHWGTPAAEPNRFTEIPEPAPTQPLRPPPPRARELQPPSKPKSPADAEAIV